MPMGAHQNNGLLYLTMDVWKDCVFFNERSFPAGHFAAGIMDVPDDGLLAMFQIARDLFERLERWRKSEGDEARMLRGEIKATAVGLVDMLWRIPPYCYMDRSVEDETLEGMLAEEDVAQGDSAASEFFLTYLSTLYSIPWGIWHFNTAGWFLEENYLRRLKKRNEDYFVAAAHDCFNSEAFKTRMREDVGMPVEMFSLTPRVDATYIFARNPDKEEMMFVNRFSFVRAIDFYTYDLFNGMAWGHAPSRCMGCGRYFLTTTGHTPKYCDGRAPQNPKYTCREYGASIRQKEQNAQHPVYRIFKTRTNTIRKHHERGKISDALRDAALEVAEKHRDDALLDSDYAADGYARDMAQDAVYEEARRRLGQ